MLYMFDQQLNVVIDLKEFNKNQPKLEWDQNVLNRKFHLTSNEFVHLPDKRRIVII